MSGARLHEGWLQTSRLRMHYRDWWGDPESSLDGPGPTMLALHGLASSCRWFDLVAPRLTDAYRVVAPDQRGHGQTDQPPTGYDWESVATDAIAFLDLLDLEMVAVMGHSWGGYVALAVAAKFPERVSRLVLIDGGFMDWTRWPGATWEWFKDLLKPRTVSGKPADFLDTVRTQLAGVWSEALEPVVMSMVRTGAGGEVRDILEPSSHAQVLKALWDEPPSTMFHLVRCPTLIVPAGPQKHSAGSEFARMRREMAHAAESAISDCRVEWLPETIHDIGYHKPAELAQVLRTFLSEA